MAIRRRAAWFLFARTNGLFSFQCATSIGLPKTAASNFPSGAPERAAVSSSCGDSVINAALCALTAENISGCEKAKRSAP